MQGGYYGTRGRFNVDDGIEGECEKCKDKEEILELLRKKKKETLDKLKMKDFDNNENEVNE